MRLGRHVEFGQSLLVQVLADRLSNTDPELSGPAQVDRLDQNACAQHVAYRRAIGKRNKCPAQACQLHQRCQSRCATKSPENRLLLPARIQSLSLKRASLLPLLLKRSHFGFDLSIGNTAARPNHRQKGHKGRGQGGVEQ